MKILDRVIATEQAAVDFGFAWAKPEQVLAQIRSELDEVAEVMHEPAQRAELLLELGDLMHACVSLSLHLDIDPRDALEASQTKYEQRLARVRQLAAEQGLSTLKGLPFQKIIELWKEAKKG